MRPLILATLLAVASCRAPAKNETGLKRLLYVAIKGGLAVYDIDRNHALLKRIYIEGLVKPRGICGSAKTRRLYISHESQLVCLDLDTGTVLWRKDTGSGADRMAITPDGRTIYLPSGFWTATPHWYVIDAATGEEKGRIEVHPATHNTLCGLDGRTVYLASRRDKYLSVVDTATNRITRRIGPFGNVVRPFTVNGRGSLVFANVDELLGFEIGDLQTGKILHRVEVEGFPTGEVEHHHCPSHGIALTPDEKELWVTDAHNQRLHLFDVTRLPPKQLASIPLRAQPGWVNFSTDGRFAYPSTGEVIDTRRREVVAVLRKSSGKVVESEQLLEIDFLDGVPAHVGNQFGVGRVQ